MSGRENEGTANRPVESPYHPRDVANSIRPEKGPEAGRPSIVVGIDGSAESRAALHWAVRQAQDVGAEVHAVAVWYQPLQFGASALAPVPPPAPQDAFVAEARAWLAEAVPEPARDTTGPVQVRTHIEQGDPVTVLLDYALRADLLVLGNKGRGALAGAALGSVAHRCAHHARCPVVLVPTPPDQDSTPPR